MSITEILGNSITGNVIGVLSLIVSIISLFITLFTMQSAKKIEKQVEKLKVTTIEKVRFQDFKPKATKKIQTYIKTIKRAQRLSKAIFVDIGEVITEIKGHDKIFDIKDYNKILEIHSKINFVCIKPKYDSYDVKVIVEELTKLKNILEKGDYVL